MKKVLCIGAAVAFSSGAVLAQELGRVLATTAVQQHVASPQQVCHDESVAVRQRSSGAGAVLGALVGGLAGNAIGGGSGRAAATGAGLVGGAMLGNQLAGSGATQYETVRRCTTQTYYRNQTVGYDVVYEYAGRQYTTRTATPPGDWIALSVQPAQASGYAPGYAPGHAPGYYTSESHTFPVQPQGTYGYSAPQPGYTPAEDTGLRASDYVAPILIGAVIAAGAHQVLRPRDHWQAPRHHHRPHPRHHGRHR